MTSDMIYKVLGAAEWDAACKRGHFAGAAVDLKDGYIHFSTADQVRETVTKHFAGQTGLVMVAFKAADFGNRLKWEVSRGGQKFPHLYDQLDARRAMAVHPLVDRSDGSHGFPETF